MKQSALFGIALGLDVVGILFFIAGTPQFDLMARNHANFAGIGFILMSGVFWVLWALAQRNDRG